MKKISRNTSSNNLIDDLSHKYIPYWPLLVMLAIPCIMLAWIYLKVKSPVYEVTASIQVKDEKKGVSEDQVTESLNVLSYKSIVENEVEIIHSKKFVDEVVKDLHLYAPTYQKGRFRTVSAYESSPVVIEAEDPDNLTEVKKVQYAYDFNKKQVQVGKKQYPINQFVSTDYGRLKFLPNPNFKKSEKGDLYFSLMAPKNVTEGVFAALDVSQVGKLSSIVKFKFKDEVPQRGEDIINAVIQKYNNATVASKTVLAKNTMAFLDQRIAKVVNDLNGVEGRIQNYRSSRGVVNLTDQSRLYLQNVAQNDQRLGDINMQLSVLDQVEKYVTTKDATTSGIVPSTLGVQDEFLGKLLEKYSDAELQYQKMKQTTGENNPAMQSLANQINSLKPSILENVKNQKINLQASRNNLNLTNNGYNSVLETIPAKERELINVSREQTTLNTLYNFLLQRREQAALAYSSSIAEIQVIDKAQSSILPVSPNKMFTYGAALVLAIVLTIAYIIYRDILSNRVLFRSDIEKNTEYPLLAEISYVAKGKEMLLTGRDFLSSQDEFKQLNIAAGFYQKEVLNRKILVTSSVTGEGKSLVAANMALNLSGAGKKVVLIDTDMEQQQLSRTFRVVDNAGLSEYLSGEINETSKILRSTGHKNLSVIGTGELASNTTELFLNGRLELLLQELEDSVDFIILDGTSVNPSAEPYILSAFCDLTLYIVRHRFTPKSFVKKLDEINDLKPLNNLALVFNGVKARGFILKTKGFGYGHKQSPGNMKLLSKLVLRKNGVYHKNPKSIQKIKQL